jgi:hypothetical protein
MGWELSFIGIITAIADRFAVSSDKFWLVSIYTLAVFGLIKLNESYYAERKKLTPEERAREDEELRGPDYW